MVKASHQMVPLTKIDQDIIGVALVLASIYLLVARSWVCLITKLRSKQIDKRGGSLPSSVLRFLFNTFYSIALSLLSTHNG